MTEASFHSRAQKRQKAASPGFDAKESLGVRFNLREQMHARANSHEQTPRQCCQSRRNRHKSANLLNLWRESLRWACQWASVSRFRSFLSS